MQRDRTFFRRIIDNLFRAYLTQRASGDADCDTLQQGRFPCAVRLLGIIVPVVAENQGCHPLMKCIVQLAEGTQIFGFYAC